MERTVLMIRAEQRTKLQDLAAQERVSTAEIHRRAIDAYNPHAATNDELEQLAEVVLRSSKAAANALNEARKAVKDSLIYFSKKEKKERKK